MNVFKASNSNFKERLIDRGYPQTMIENLLSDTKFIERESALLKHNNKEEKEILPFVTQYQVSIFLFSFSMTMKFRVRVVS